MKDEARVFFLSNSTRFDTSSAEDYGIREWLFDREPNPFQTEAFRQEVTDRLVEVEFDPEIDFIALTGGSLQIALLLGFVMQAYKYDEISVLLFDARIGKYNSRTLEVVKG